MLSFWRNATSPEIICFSSKCVWLVIRIEHCVDLNHLIYDGWHSKCGESQRLSEFILFCVRGEDSSDYFNVHCKDMASCMSCVCDLGVKNRSGGVMDLWKGKTSNYSFSWVSKQRCKATKQLLSRQKSTWSSWVWTLKSCMASLSELSYCSDWYWHSEGRCISSI